MREVGSFAALMDVDAGAVTESFAALVVPLGLSLRAIVATVDSPELRAAADELLLSLDALDLAQGAGRTAPALDDCDEDELDAPSTVRLSEGALEY